MNEFEAMLRFQNHLTDLGIPINGISKVGDGYEIDYKPEATALQKTTAEAEKATFDFRPRKRNLAAIKTWYTSLSATDKAKLQAAVFIQFVFEQPEIVDALNLSIPLPFDNS